MLASQAAHTYAKEQNVTYIHAYDDLAVMAGQGTLADEIVMSGKGPFDVAFLQVGGGGMAAATATWLKMNFARYPHRRSRRRRTSLHGRCDQSRPSRRSG